MPPSPRDVGPLQPHIASVWAPYGAPITSNMDPPSPSHANVPVK